MNNDYLKRFPHIDYTNPRGLWSIVKPCAECKHYMLDRFTMWLFDRRKYGTRIGQPRHNRHFEKSPIDNSYIEGNGNICNECALASLTFSPLEQCGGCGKISGRRAIYYRNDCCMSSEIYGSYKTYTPMLCMSCWNKLRPITKIVRESEDIAKTCRMLLSHGLTNLRRHYEGREDKNILNNWRIASLLSEDSSRSIEGKYRCS